LLATITTLKSISSRNNNNTTAEKKLGISNFKKKCAKHNSAYTCRSGTKIIANINITILQKLTPGWLRESLLLLK